MGKVIVTLMVLVFNVTALAGDLTLANLLLRTRAYWGEYNSANSGWPDSVLIPIINDAEAMIAHVGKAIERDTTILLDSLVDSYDLPSDFDGPLLVRKYGKTTVPGILTFVPFPLYSQGYDNQGNVPEHYSIGDNDLWVWPLPTESSKDSLRLVYYASPSGMDSTSDTCDLTGYWERLIPLVAKDLIKLKDLTADQLLAKITAEIQAWQREHLMKQAEAQP